MDMTPKMKKVQAIVGGDVTFLGQFHKEKEVEGVILVAKRGAEADGLALSKQAMQPPFSKEKIYGDVLLMRTDEGGTPVDFTKAEYEKFAARTDVEEIEIPEDSEEEEVDPNDYDSHEDDEEVEGESDSEEEEADEGNLLDMLMPMILQKFEAENGRAPEAHELAAIQAAMLQKFGQAGPEPGMETIAEEEEEEDEEEEVEETKENVVIKANATGADKKRSSSSSSKRVSLEETTTTSTSTSSKKARRV